MVFASNLFLLYFLPFFLLAYLVTPQKFRNVVALLGSLAFYAWGSPKFVFALLGIALVNYFVALQLGKRDRNAGKWLTAAVFFNLGILLYFKYANFFVGNTNAVLGQMGISTITWTTVALPLGISFFTFQQLSYLIDVRRGEKPPLKNPVDYLLLVCMFPHLIAGPILRYRDLADQIRDRSHQENISFRLSGMIRFAIGLGRKVLIADTIAMEANKIFALPHAQLDFTLCWMAAIGFAFVIYHDFAGYSDMAIGLGRMIGFRFPENFRIPYSSGSITEFWRRWHISLTSFLTDYVFTPVSLSFRNLGMKGIVLAILITFLLSGLWHGAAWTFILFGLWHGVWLALERVFLLKWLEKLPMALRVAWTFLLCALGYVFFAANSLSTAGNFFKEMFSFEVAKTPWADLGIMAGNKFWFMVALAALISFSAAIPGIAKWQDRCFELPEKAWQTVAWTGIALALLVLGISEIGTMGFRPFLYYMF